MRRVLFRHTFSPSLTTEASTQTHTDQCVSLITPVPHDGDSPRNETDFVPMEKQATYIRAK